MGAEPEEPEGGLGWYGHNALKKQWVGGGHNGRVKRNQEYLEGATMQDQKTGSGRASALEKLPRSSL